MWPSLRAHMCTEVKSRIRRRILRSQQRSRKMNAEPDVHTVHAIFLKSETTRLTEEVV